MTEERDIRQPADQEASEQQSADQAVRAQQSISEVPEEPEAQEPGAQEPEAQELEAQKPDVQEPKAQEREIAAPRSPEDVPGARSAGSSEGAPAASAPLWRRALRVAASKLGVAAAVLIAFWLGARLGGGGSGSGRGHAAHAEAKKKEQIWTCSMHPQIRQKKPGKCPICGMDLIPADSMGGKKAAGPRELRMTERARSLAEVEVTPVVRRRAAAEVRVVGKVRYDERRVGYITSWVAGRIDKLFVRFTGVKVRRWQPMVWVYSPELVTAQMELLEAVRELARAKASGVPGMDQTARSMLLASRHKLALLGLTAGQIKGIERRGKPLDHLTLYAPVGGTVVEKKAQEQMYVKPGTRLYTIADLRKVWVKLDVYESDLGRVRVGEKVSFTAESLPGRTFEGTVEFIDPFVDDRTRTVKVRLTVDNRDGLLKPDMYVRAVLRSRVRAGSAGKEAKETPSAEPLVIPVTAPLITGKRAVVYVEKEPGLYQGREVVLGPRVGRYYVVEKGLEEGERVVTRGSFQIDSALQILAKPSMMNPTGGGPVPGHHHHGGARPRPSENKAPGRAAASEAIQRVKAPAPFQRQLAAVLRAYYDVHDALRKDSVQGAVQAAKTVLATLGKVNMGLLEGHAHMLWMQDLDALKKAATRLSGADSLKTARFYFDALSRATIRAVKRFGVGGAIPVYRFHCTMAFGNKGADWLQPKPGTLNPYFGSGMLTCGDQVEAIETPNHQ